MIGKNLYLEQKARNYLDKKLDKGHHELVYGLASYWGSLYGLGRWDPFYGAAWSVQDRLIREFHYLECPYCRWATHHLDNHVWCQAELKSKADQNND